MVDKRTKPSGKHKRPSADELDERVVMPLDPADAIEAIMQVDAEKVREAEPKRDREKK